MITILICIGVYLVWLTLAICWFISNLGNKNKEGAWWQWILCAPLIPVVLVVGLYHKRKGNKL